MELPSFHPMGSPSLPLRPGTPHNSARFPWAFHGLHLPFSPTLLPWDAPKGPISSQLSGQNRGTPRCTLSSSHLGFLKGFSWHLDSSPAWSISWRFRKGCAVEAPKAGVARMMSGRKNAATKLLQLSVIEGKSCFVRSLK